MNYIANTTSVLGTSQLLNLPQQTNVYQKSQSNLNSKSPQINRKTGNPSSPMNSTRPKQPQQNMLESQGQALRAFLKDTDGAGAAVTDTNLKKEGSEHLQNAPKTARRRQRVNTFKESSQSRLAAPNMQTPKTGNMSARRKKDDSSFQNTNGKLSARDLQKSSSAQLQAKQVRPPLKPLASNINNGSGGSKAYAPMPLNNPNKKNSRILSYLDRQQKQQFQPQSNMQNISNQHSSRQQECQPHIASLPISLSSYKQANPPLILTKQQNNTELVVRRQDTSDCLDVSDEHQQKQLEDFSSARTHLHDFQVRKSPIHNLEPDESLQQSNLLQIQIQKEQRSDSQGKMFSHPYGHADQYSEQSTRGNTKRNGDSSSAAYSARVKRDKIGSLIATDVLKLSFGAQKAQEKKIDTPKETQQLSITQSLISALGNLVSRGSSASKTPREKEAGSLSARQRNNEQLKTSQTFTSKADVITSKNVMTDYARAQGANKENPMIQVIQETTQPIYTEHNSQRVENDGSKSNVYQQWGQMETEEVGVNGSANKCGLATDISMRMNTLAKFTNQNLGGLKLAASGRRNEILKTQTYMDGFSQFSKSRSPMKSRKFTRPAQKPQEDEIVESMNIVTIDMIEEQKQAQSKAMRISEPQQECKGCPDCHTDNSYCSNDDNYRAPVVQQRTTTLNPQTATVCSCSGCMASQTAYMPAENADEGQRPTRICLETVLTECDQIRALFPLLAQPRFNQVMLLDQKKILLERIQTYCEEWWSASQQFHNLHAVFEQDGTTEGQIISILIKKSQIVLCVTIGLIAALSIEVQSSYLDSLVISQTFQCPRLILKDAYSVQMKLTYIILRKMDRQERQTNEFAIKLQERIDKFKDEFNSDLILANTQNEYNDGEMSQFSSGTENSQELEHFLRQRLQHQTDLLQQQCYKRPLPQSQLELYQNLLAISAEIIDLNNAKDLIANEVNAIQENATAQSDIPEMNLDSEQEQENMIPGCFVRPPAIQITPQMSESAGSMVNDSMPAGTRPIEDMILQKQNRLTKENYLSEICEEPRSTEHVSPSVEPEISRISQSHSDLGLGNLPVLARRESSGQQTKQEIEEAADCIEAHDPLIDIENIDQDDHHFETGAIKGANATLPPSTKKYTLILDLDETLIHSHVQYKQRLETRAQQQAYFNELQQKFIGENGREPSKEELENMALEMVFNIRPFAEDFLNTMAKDFEITVFTAGEQDYADEILNTLDQERSITHRLYRQHTLQVKDVQSGATKHYIKDLELTGRDLSKTIIIDNIKENFCRQPKNGIQITTWKDDPYDTELMYLQRLLLNMVRQDPVDVRENLDRFKENGLLPQHFAEPTDDESSSFQHFEPVVVATSTTTPGKSSNNTKQNSINDNLDQFTAEKPQKQNNSGELSMQSIASMESGRSSVKQKSVANSSFQRRRLSCESLQNDQDNQLKINEEDSEAESFFVDDVPVRIELKESTECLTKHGSSEFGNIRHEEEISHRQTTSYAAYAHDSAESNSMCNQIENKNTAFVETTTN